MDSSISRPTFSAGRMATSHFNDDGLEKTYLVRPRASAATTHLATVPCVHATVLREVSNIQNSAGHGQPRRSCRPTAQLSSQGFRILLQLSRPEERRQQCRALLHSGTRVSNMHLSYSFRGDSLSLRTAPLSGGKNDSQAVKPPRRGKLVFQVHDAVFYPVLPRLYLRTACCNTCTWFRFLCRWYFAPPVDVWNIFAGTEKRHNYV